MSDQAPPFNLNSPIIAKAAQKAKLSVPEFVELSVLITMENVRMTPNLFRKQTVLESLKALRARTAIIAEFSGLPKEEQHRLLENPEYKCLKLNLED